MSFNGLSVVQDNLKSLSGVLLRHALSNHKLQIIRLPFVVGHWWCICLQCLYTRPVEVFNSSDSIVLLQSLIRFLRSFAYEDGKFRAF